MHSSDCSSETSSVSEEEELVLDFGFGLEHDIQDIVRLGTLGQFQQARSLADESLKELDYLFPIAIEIMRLMYDQEDFKALHAYTKDLMSRRLRHESWTPTAVYILHLVHDVSGMLQGNLTNAVTTPYDLSAANMSGRNPENLDNEQILAATFILKVVYANGGEAQNSAALHQRVLPTALRQERGLYAFIGTLIQRRNYWAAANVMSICLQLRSADYAALWKGTERFLRGDPRKDDEPTAYFRMMLMQTFMEGLLHMGPNSSGNRSNLWASFKTASDLLRPVLQRKFGKGVWQSSRGYWRCQLLQIDKAISNRNPQVRQPALRQVQQLLPLLHAHARRHDDRSLLNKYRLRINLLVRSTPQSPMTYLNGAAVVPAAGSAIRPTSTFTKSRPAEHQALPATQPARRSEVPIRNVKPTRAPQAQPMAMQPRPPWQHSQSLGGYFLYNPRTDMIMLQDGRQYQRPSRIPVTALSSAIWEESPSAPIQPDPWLHGQGSRSQGQKSASRQVNQRGSYGSHSSSRIEGRAGRYGRREREIDDVDSESAPEEDGNEDDNDDDDDHEHDENEESSGDSS